MKFKFSKVAEKELYRFPHLLFHCDIFKIKDYVTGSTSNSI